MAEWLYEDGIGERRAALVAHGRIIEARIERDDDGVAGGGIHRARIVSRRDRVARLDSGEEVIVSGALPSEGRHCLLSITRSAIPERDLIKRAKAEIVLDPAKEVSAAPAMPLYDSIALHHGPPRIIGQHEADALEDAGWSELLDAARTGIFPFSGGVARMALTPAMTVFDVDGPIGSSNLALEGAIACARSCRLLGIGGSIAIDLPTIRPREQRAAVETAFAAALGDGSETVLLPVNRLGLLHLSRPRPGPNIAERMRFAPVQSAALGLLRGAERARGTGPMILTANPAVIDWVAARPALTDLLARRSGRSVTLQADGARTIWAGDAR